MILYMLYMLVVDIGVVCYFWCLIDSCKIFGIMPLRVVALKLEVFYFILKDFKV